MPVPPPRRPSRGLLFYNLPSAKAAGTARCGGAAAVAGAEEVTSERIERARRGDLDAFDELVAEYEKRVWSLAHHIAGNSEDAREITQEVFLRVYRHLGTYDPRRPFESWLFRIAVNCSWDYLEKRPTHAALDALPSVSVRTARSDPRERPDRVLAGHEVRAALRSLLGLLTPQERTVFILRDVHGLPTREIAFILKCTSITVRRHSSSARLKMRRALAERYPDLLVDRDLE